MRISRVVTSNIFWLVSAVFACTSARAAPTLTNITVNPANPVISIGQRQDFTASGLFSDGSRHALGPTVTQVVGGDRHTCELLAGGAVQCWGDNSSGQLGDGTNTRQFKPVRVVGISTATALAGGRYHTCALLADGTVRCWGYNYYGGLGNGTTTNSNVPVVVSGLSDVTALAAGDAYTCALLNGGALKCWGFNLYGELGNGTTVAATTPVNVSGISTATAVATGYSHTCAVLAGGTAACWGSNFSGELGGGTTTPYSTNPLPVPVIGISTATALAAGANSTCAVLDGGALRCWGSNVFGQLGDGTMASSNTPVSVSGIDSAVSVSAGQFHACALLAGGGVQCWGSNYYGELGDGTTTASSVPVSVLDGATAISAVANHSFALLASGAALGWGENPDGQLNDGTTTSSSTPVLIRGTPGVDWTSSDPTVATVDAFGSALGLSPGNTTIAATTPGGVSGNSRLTVNGPSSNTADLSLTLTDAPDPVALNGILTYTLTVTNKGPDAAPKVRANDILPAGVTLLSVAPNRGTCNVRDLVKCSLGTLKPGASAKVVIKVRPTVAGLVRDYANAWSESDVVDPDQGNNKAVATSRVK